MNENTLEEVARVQSSIFYGVVLLFVFAVTLIALTAIVIVSTPIRNYLPGYSDAEISHSALKNAIIIDSLEQQMQRQHVYIENIRAALLGKITLDSVKAEEPLVISENDKSLQKTENEQKFVERYQQEESYNLSANAADGKKSMAEDAIFFKPLKGLVTSRFNPSVNQFGVDVAAASKEPVVAVLEGTVIFSGFDPYDGYILQIQHGNGFVSIYKRNELLLKKTGEKVRTGEAIALVGNAGDESGKKGLHFELWYKGNPVNPESYVSF
ncbi:MAG: M23 family metallopeptidase [Dysgonamonadaceae bacterium]